MIKYRKLCSKKDGRIQSLWEYNPKHKEERVIWSAHTSINRYSSDWTRYFDPGNDSLETDITQEEAEEIMFLENI